MINLEACPNYGAQSARNVSKNALRSEYLPFCGWVAIEIGCCGASDGPIWSQEPPGIVSFGPGRRSVLNRPSALLAQYAGLPKCRELGFTLQPNFGPVRK